MPKPITRLKMQANAKLGLRNGESRTIGDDEKKERSTNSRNPTKDSHAAVAMVGSLSHSWRCPSSSTYSKQPRNVAMATRCNQSIRLSIAKFGWSMPRTTANDNNVTATPGTILT